MSDNDLRFCTECGAQMPGFSEPAPLPLTSYSPAPSQPTMIAPPPPPPSSAPAAAPYAPVERKPNPLIWILIPVGLVVVAVIVVIAFKASTPGVSNSNNTSYDAGSNRNTALTSTPQQRGRLAICKFDPVHVRDSPRLDGTIITDIGKDQRVWVISESSNYDTVFIRSLNQSVYDNWSEIEVENTSTHGWVFSAFLR